MCSATNRRAETHPYDIIESPGVLDGTAEVQAIKCFAKSTISMTLCEMIKEELADYLLPLFNNAGDNSPYLFGAPFVDINPFVFVKICKAEISQDFCSNSSSNFTKKL